MLSILTSTTVNVFSSYGSKSKTNTCCSDSCHSGLNCLIKATLKCTLLSKKNPVYSNSLLYYIITTAIALLSLICYIFVSIASTSWGRGMKWLISLHLQRIIMKVKKEIMYTIVDMWHSWVLYRFNLVNVLKTSMNLL